MAGFLMPSTIPFLVSLLFVALTDLTPGSLLIFYNLQISCLLDFYSTDISIVTDKVIY